jgi:hypothetical protein
MTLPQLSVTGSGNVVTLEEEITGFDKVDVSHAFEVEISRAEAFSVIVHIDDNLRQHLRVVKRGSTLMIGLEPGRLSSIGEATLEAEVTMPELTGVALSGASEVAVAGFESMEPLDVSVSGASRLRGEIEAGDGVFEISGASRVSLAGSAGDVTIDASGASRLELSDFAVRDADVEASGASEVVVNPSGRLDARASGTSRVYYLGSPSLGEIEASGASSVKRR